MDVLARSVKVDRGHHSLHIVPERLITGHKCRRHSRNINLFHRVSGDDRALLGDVREASLAQNTLSCLFRDLWDDPEVRRVSNAGLRIGQRFWERLRIRFLLKHIAEYWQEATVKSKGAAYFDANGDVVMVGGDAIALRVVFDTGFFGNTPAGSST